MKPDHGMVRWLTTQPVCECVDRVRTATLETLEAALPQVRKLRGRKSLIRQIESRIRALRGHSRRGCFGGG